jgi:Ca-activated chloride channel family protein
MTTRSLFIFVIAVVAGTLFAPSVALADGIIIPNPPISGPMPIAQLAIRYHHVEVNIKDQVAVTHVDQVFYNPNDWQVEGSYVFPLPEGATVSDFVLWIDGQPVEGEVLDAQEAREVYEEIVRTMKDPALLEYIGQGAVQASIFPIPAYGERRIELEYSQVLGSENGLVRYVYPLNTEKFSVQPLENVSINVNLESSQAIRAAYSPTHSVDISRESSSQMSLGYEESFVTPDTDFAMYYSIGETEAIHMLSYRDPSDPVDKDGFFLLMLAPSPDVDVRAQAKDLILVLDRSGSMEGDKFIQAQEAIRYILSNLNAEDRFNVVSFSTGIDSYASGLRPSSEANQAIAWTDRLSPNGSTDINRALLEAAYMADSERPTYLIFLTDGLPTNGVVESQQILDNLAEFAPSNLRLFAFGVGYDVDTFLLDSLAQAHHGSSSYVLPGERLDEILSSFYAKVSSPVLTDLKLDFGEMRVYDLYPKDLPDLFSGSQIMVMGRYREGGSEKITLTGTVNQETQTFTFRNQNFAVDSRGENKTLATLPRLWATRKIGNLLNQIRLNGPEQESVEQIVRLSIRYGVVTPYTSFLVTEPMLLGEAEQNRIADDEFADMEAQSLAPSYGQGAVEKAAEQGALADADSPVVSSNESADMIRNLGSRSFVNVNGVWMDTAFDPEKTESVNVAFLSDDYFALVSASPELAAAFALGERVIALANGIFYEVVGSDDESDALDIPAAIESDQRKLDEGMSQTESKFEEMQTRDSVNALSCVSAIVLLSVLPLLTWTRRRNC